MTNQFYVTLPSNSSAHVFSDNKISHFKTQLFKRISLEGDWEVGLCEIDYSKSFATVPKGDFWIGYEFDLNSLPVDSDSFTEDNLNESVSENSGFDQKMAPFEENDYSIMDPEGRGKLFFPSKSYSSIESLLGAIRSNRVFQSVAEISVFQSRIQITLKRHVKRLILSYSLQRIFGLEGIQINKPLITGGDECNLKACCPTQMFIYTDIIEPQIVGDVVAPLLRIVNIDNLQNNSGNQVAKIFTHPHYVPLLTREFHQVEIDIRDDLGFYLPFTDGRLNVKLHFRKINLNQNSL